MDTVRRNIIVINARNMRHCHNVSCMWRKVDIVKSAWVRIIHKILAIAQESVFTAKVPRNITAVCAHQNSELVNLHSPETLTEAV